MKTKVIIGIFLIAVLLVPDMDAWWSRISRTGILSIPGGNPQVAPPIVTFRIYDSNNDNCLEMDEIAETLGRNNTEVDIVMAFNETDTNGDMKISQQEFLDAEPSVIKPAK